MAKPIIPAQPITFSCLTCKGNGYIDQPPIAANEGEVIEPKMVCPDCKGSTKKVIEIQPSHYDVHEVSDHRYWVPVEVTNNQNNTDETYDCVLINTNGYHASGVYYQMTIVDLGLHIE